ncbi:unnamed protein product [Adineta steineri]|uniref:Uncharacterized protein n=1 Tax=Adineta steineri TaxID=433720 RepID=A0A813N9S1_9BILA|nr:unnamed protein product [Adineta steineri]CAF3857258.1 unnamed protein product [Adineta steineri]
MASTEELNTNETTSSRRIIRFCERIVNIFQLNLNGTEDLKKTSLGRLDFTNTFKLDVKLPFNKHFSKSIPKLYQLTSLNVQLTTDYTNQSDLRVLLEQAPNLHTLSVLCPTKTTLKYFLAVINNPSILKLNLPKAVSLTDVDIVGVEQTSLCVRYALKDQSHETFLMFISVKNQTGPRLGKLIIKSIIDLSMD